MWLLWQPNDNVLYQTSYNHVLAYQVFDKGLLLTLCQRLAEIHARLFFPIYQVLDAGISLEGEKPTMYVADAKHQLVDSAKELERPTFHLSKQINDLEAQIEEQQLVVVRLEGDDKSIR